MSAFLTILGVVATPWMLIIMVGHWWRRGYYHVDDLQVFNRGEHGGRYWAWHGINIRGFAAWIPAAGIGLLFANTSLLTGPFANSANGIDLSLAIAGVLGVLLYVLMLIAVPEPAEVYRSADRPRAGWRRPHMHPALVDHARDPQGNPPSSSEEGEVVNSIAEEV